MPEKSEFLKQAAKSILAKNEDSSKYLNLFLFFHETGDADSRCLVDELTKAVSRDFECFVKEISLEELSPEHSNSSSSEVIQCIGVDSRRIEWFRSLLKEVFWKRHRERLQSRPFVEVMGATENTVVTPFRLSDYGLFVPYIVKKRRTIRVHSFQHQPFYRYRLCTNKTDMLPAPFREFLYLIFQDCPNHLYQASGFRASQQRFKVKAEFAHTQKHEIIELAEQSKSFTKFRSGHENLANYFLQNDPRSIACEIPVWMESVELSDYHDVFHTKAPLTGHIDLLRYEDGKIVVWDYKPNARREVTAATQVFLYALMLSVRTGISLKQFTCGYFDERDCYMFNPYDADL
jgi:hypothetical protein